MSGASRLIRGNELLSYQDWHTIPRRFKAEATRWVYIGPNGSWWDLEGRDAGKQGVRLAKELQGAYHLPFEHLLTEAAYQVGATYERSNIQKRIINFGVVAGARGSQGHEAHLRRVQAYRGELVERVASRHPRLAGMPHPVRWLALGASPVSENR
jgi:hypothetical protein